MVDNGKEEGLMDSLAEALQEHLGAPRGEQPGEWSRVCCELSREINIVTWTEELPKAEVAELIPLLKKAASLMCEGGEAKRYRENVLTRARSLENYLVDGSPALPADAGETERKALEAKMFANEPPSPCLQWLNRKRD